MRRISWGAEARGCAVDVVEGTEEFQGGDGGEGAQERCRQAWDDVEVRGGRVDEGEQGGTVDTLAKGEDPVEVRLGLDREVESLEPSVSPDVAQVQHRDSIVLNVTDDVGFGELLRRLAERLHEGVGTQRNGVGRKQRELLFEHDLCHLIVSHDIGSEQPRPTPGREGETESCSENATRH